jgi:hypothetical protein
MACTDPRVETRRFECAGGRYVACGACGGDLCTAGYTERLTPSRLRPEHDDDNLCATCRPAR